MNIENINELISKKSGITAILIYVLLQMAKSDSDNAVWYALGMVLSGVTYMILDFSKGKKKRVD
jgi:hypothetical protein